MPFRSILPALFIVLFTPPLYADLNSANADRARGDYSAAAVEYQRLAEGGDPVAQVNLGYMYYVGEGVTQDYGQALAWYNEAASQGNADAQYNLAVAFAFGEGVGQDFVSAVEWYRAAAEQGHAVAQYSLGLSYAYGEGVARDPVEAANWFSRSAEQGYERAQTLLGTKYHTGDGVSLNYEAAVKWYRMAAEQGDAMAQYNLAGMYRSGNGVGKDNNEALNWYRKAADQGYSAATVELATLERSVAAQSGAVSGAAELPVAGATIEASMQQTATAEIPEVPAGNQTAEASQALETTTEAPTERVVQHSDDISPAYAITPPQQATAATTARLIENQLANLDRGTPGNTQSEWPAASATNKPELLSMEGIDPDLPESSASAASELLSDTSMPGFAPPGQPNVLPTTEQGDEPPLDLPAAEMAEPPIAATDAGFEYPKTEPVQPTSSEGQTQDGFFSRLFAKREPAQSDNSTYHPAVGQTESAPAEQMVGGFAAISAATNTMSGTDTPIILYENGLNELKNKNFGTAVNNFKSAAARGHPLAQYQLASHYHQGLGIKQNNEEAALWYRRAAELGIAEAQYNLGNMYLLGEGILPDDTQARYWYEQAAAEGHTGAIHNLQNLSRLNPVPIEDSGSVSVGRAIEPTPDLPMTAVQTFEPDTVTTPTSNDAYNAQLDYERGLAYSYGEDVAKDLQQAFALFKSAAENNYAPAQYKLGVAYAYGEGTSSDLDQAFYWYEKAALQGHPIAQRNLGLSHQNGAGTGVNKTLALAWFGILAERGNVMDIRRKEVLASELNPEEIRSAELLKLDLLDNIETADK